MKKLLILALFLSFNFNNFAQNHMLNVNESDFVISLDKDPFLHTLAQQKAPYYCCDSITYWTKQGQGFIVGLDTSAIVHNADSMDILWQVCNSSACYEGEGMTDTFFQVMLTDTLKVCYDVMIYEESSVEVCSMCDSLIFDQNTYSWILFSNSKPLEISEIRIGKFNNTKIYDLIGKELKHIPIGSFYIRNNKKYFRYE
tara:strand:- start:9 stop:605 length:597 start_codon:yes stop_codon:yes gene_type:complete